MRTVKIAIIVIFLLFGAAMVAFQSEWGMRLAQKFLLEALAESGYRVEIGKIEGTLPHEIDLKNVRIESDTLSVSIDSLDARLSLWALLQKEVLFTDVRANGISWEERPGTLPSLGKGNGLSFSLRVKHFLLTNVALLDDIRANFEGALRIGKKNRDFFLSLTAARPEFPESTARLLAYVDANGGIRLKGSLKSPTLKVLPFSLPFDASANLRFAIRGKEELSGRITGTLSELPFTANGRAKFDPRGHFETASLAVKSQAIAAKFKIASAEGGGIRVSGDAKAARFIDSIHADLLWKDKSLAGSGTADGSIDGKTWKGKTDLSWEPGGSFFLTHAALEGSSSHASGNLEIRPDKILLGQTDLDIENLQDLPFGIYGKLQGKLDWLAANGRQVVTADLKATGFYWKDLFAETVRIDASFVDPFGSPQGRAALTGEDVKWRQMFLNRLSFETLLGASDFWPFALAASGKWKHPLELNLSGVWHYDDSQFASTIDAASGSFYNHPIALAKSVNIGFSPEEFHVSGLDLSLSDGRLYLSVEERKDDLAAELILEKFPLDVFSLNPLDVAISGETDSVISIHEKNGNFDGKLSAKIHQMKVAAAGATPPLSASGSFEGRFDKERLNLNGGLHIGNTPLLTLDLSLPLQIKLMPLRANPVYDQNLRGSIALNGRIEEILDFFDLGMHRIAGDIASAFTLGGTLSAPQVKGTLHFENGSYENYLTGTRFLDIRAEGKANGDTFILDSLAASQAEGRLRATGEIALRPADGFPFLFDIAFTHLLIAQIDLMATEAEGKIQIIGDINGAEAKGRIEVVQSDLHIPDRIPRSLPNLVVVYRNAIKPVEGTIVQAAPYPLRLDLEVKAPDGIYIEGRGLDSEWKGDFHVDGTYADPTAEGKLELIKGEFVFAGRHFKLVDGALSLTGKEREMPYLNLAAEMRVKDVSITVRMKGPLNNPQLTLQSVPPLPLGTIMAYLLFGQELAEINSYQAQQLANSIASLAGQGPDVLESTRKTLGVDKINIVSVPSDEPGIEDAIAVQVGKYISESVLVSLTQGAEESSTNINIEIELKGGWAVQLESDQRQEQGKFTVKWNHNY